MTAFDTVQQRLHNQYLLGALLVWADHPGRSIGFTYPAHLLPAYDEYTIAYAV